MMISDKILYDKQIELYVKQMFQWVLFFVFSILVDFWSGGFSIVIRFFRHPFEVVAWIFLSTAKMYFLPVYSKSAYP